MKDKGNLFLGVLWLALAPIMYFIDNYVLAITWLCAGIFELIVWKKKKDKS